MINLEIIEKNAKNLNAEKIKFKNSNFNLIAQIIYSVLSHLQCGQLPVSIFKKEVLSKRNNPKEYLKELIKFAQQ